MAAKINFAAYCLFDPDSVGFIVDPSLFKVNKKAPFFIPCFYLESDKFLTDTDRREFV